MQTALSHAQNRLTTMGHIKQTDADNMYSFCNLTMVNSCSQVRNEKNLICMNYLPMCCIYV